MRLRVNLRFTRPSGTILRGMNSAYVIRRPAVWYAIYLLCVLVPASAPPFLFQTPQRAPTGRPTGRQTEVAVPMPDDVTLRARVLLPSDSGRFPTLLYRTPYNKQSALEEYTTFEKAVARGYAVVVQDVRGRYASDGEFVAYQNEGRDGYDTIEWA